MNNIKCNDTEKANVFLMQLRHDMYIGTFCSWKKYLMVFIVFIFLCMNFQRSIWIEEKYKELNGTPNLADYIIDIYKGIEPIDTKDKNIRFEVPAGWLLINIYLSFIVGYYPLNDLKRYGVQVLIRSKSRWKWWINKCLWIITTVLIYYMIAYTVMILFSVFNGGISLNNTYEINLSVSGINTYGILWREVVLTGIILPIIISIALSLFQMVMALFTSSILSNIMVITIIISSVYYCNKFWVGNYLMIWRNSIIIGEIGVNTIFGIVFGIVISIIVIILGGIKFKKIDILNS